VSTPQRPPTPEDPAADTRPGGSDHARDGGLADTRDLVDIPAVEVISRAAVLLMSAAALTLRAAFGSLFARHLRAVPSGCLRQAISFHSVRSARFRGR